MNKDINKVKELLHLPTFVPIAEAIDCAMTTLAKGTKEFYNDHRFKKWAAPYLVAFPTKYCFVGGKHKSIFFFLIAPVPHPKATYQISCPAKANRENAEQDLPLLKAFLESQYKQVTS